MDERILGQPISRRGLLKATGSMGLAGLAYPWLSAAKAISAATARLPRTFPIDHIVVDMQENRSFDHYYGFAPFVGQPYGVPDGYSQPDGHGGSVAPYHSPASRRPTSGMGGTPHTANTTPARWTASTPPTASTAWATTPPRTFPSTTTSSKTSLFVRTTSAR